MSNVGRCLHTCVAFALALITWVVPLRAEEPAKTLKLGVAPNFVLGDYWVALSRDGKELAYRTNVNTIGIFDPLTRKPIRELTIEQKEIGEQLFYTADGKHLLFQSTIRVTLVDPMSGKVVKSVGNKQFWESHQFAWNDDVSAMISHQDNYHFDNVPKQCFWNSKGEMTGEEKVGPTGRRSQAISGNGKLVVTGASNHRKAKDTDEPLDEYVTLWNPDTRKEQGRIHLGKDIRPTFLSLNRDGRYLIAATNSADRMELWNTKEGKKIAGLGKLPEGLYRCTYSPDDQKVAIQTGNGYVGVYELASGKKLLEYQFTDLSKGLFGNCPAGVGFRDNGDVIACYGSKNRAFVKNLRQKEETPEAKFDGHTSQVIQTHWAADGQSLLTVGGDKQVRRWDTTTGRLLETVVADEPRPASWWQAPVSISADGKWLAVLSVGLAKLYNLETKKEVANLVFKDQRHYPHWKGFAFSEDGKKVFGYGEAQERRDDFRIVIHSAAVCWNTDNGTHVSEFFDHTTRDGKKVFDTHYGKEKLMVQKNAEQLPELQIGTAIRDPWASSTNAGPLMVGNTITLRDRASKKAILQTTLSITGQGISLSPDGKRLALPMTDYSVLILDLPSGK